MAGPNPEQPASPPSKIESLIERLSDPTLTKKPERLKAVYEVFDTKDSSLIPLEPRTENTLPPMASPSNSQATPVFL